uniref:UDP-N-acetyl-D-glucosamine dehydrogenase n=1 Tax=Candidatus Kentrum sp. LPFa TaxID=2126335 RepID=A0A450W404_9GAMM|nr:MAG: UDP-N-acetyl-D-glucosamine dehydrogenase [Candidatus Kentron sp. LPFa]
MDTRFVDTDNLSAASGLLAKIKDKTAKVCIVGLGYVGLPLVLRTREVGFHVIGLDVDDEKIEQLRQGKSYINHIQPERIHRSLATGFLASSDFSVAQEADIIILCVPTPLNKYREPDLSYVEDTVDALLPHLRMGQMISLESTTYPGTTEEVLLPKIKHAGLEVGTNFHLVYSPEREDPGNPEFDTRSIPKIVGGCTPACLDIGTHFYASIIDRVVPVSSTRTAELIKLIENIHRAVNIGLVNEIKIIADRMGIDIHEAIDAAATKPFGFTAYYPGPGIGGHCIPIDPFYLTWKAREYNLHTHFIELAGEINANMPGWVVNKVINALNDRGKSLKGSRILVLGLAYKKNTDDTRESPSAVLLDILAGKGALVAYSDPYIPRFPKMRNYEFKLESVALTPENIAQFDALLLATDHDNFDYDLLRRHARLIIDTRGIYRDSHDNVVSA